MVRRIVLPILALIMLLPPGLCACSHEHVVRIDLESRTITEIIVTPELKPIRHHCHRHKHPEKLAELPQSIPVPHPEEPTSDHSHDPFCPAMMPLDLQQPSQQLAFSNFFSLATTIETVPWLCIPTDRSYVSDVRKPLGSPPIFISHCALLI